MSAALGYPRKTTLQVASREFRSENWPFVPTFFKNTPKILMNLGKFIGSCNYPSIFLNYVSNH